MVPKRAHASSIAHVPGGGPVHLPAAGCAAGTVGGGGVGRPASCSMVGAAAQKEAQARAREAIRKRQSLLASGDEAEEAQAAAHHRIRGLYLRWRARRRCEALRVAREREIIRLLSSPNTKKLGGRFGIRSTFNAPGTKTNTVCCDNNGQALNPDKKGCKQPRQLHPDFAWLVRGLTLFYNEHNPEGVKNVRSIAQKSQGQAAALRERLIAKYPSVPTYAFDWLQHPPSERDLIGEASLTQMHSSPGPSTSSPLGPAPALHGTSSARSPSQNGSSVVASPASVLARPTPGNGARQGRTRAASVGLLLSSSMHPAAAAAAGNGNSSAMHLTATGGSSPLGEGKQRRPLFGRSPQTPTSPKTPRFGGLVGSFFSMGSGGSGDKKHEDTTDPSFGMEIF